MAHGSSAHSGVESILMQQIPGATAVVRATKADDRNGTDYWVHRGENVPLSVDAKVRSIDYATRGEDDLALEVWSVKEQCIPGWSRNPNKRTDYILWLWQDTGRWCLVPFPMLCAVFEDNFLDWYLDYRTATQSTPERGYHSECVFVPRRVVWAAIYERFA